MADRLGIPLYAIDLAADFGRIIDYFAAEYGRGRTPNPCVRCNAWLKFGRLFGEQEKDRHNRSNRSLAFKDASAQAP